MAAQLFIGNLSKDTRVRDLENVFLKHGRLLRCDIKRDLPRSYLKGYGFVEYEDTRDAEEAIRREDGRKLLGSRLMVEWARGSYGDKNRRGRERYGGMGRRSPPPRERMMTYRERSPIFRERFSYRERSPPPPRFPPREPFRGRRSLSPYRRRDMRDMDRYERDRYERDYFDRRDDRRY